MNYKCMRCSFDTKYFNDIKRHLNRKKICSKNLESFDYNDEELIKLTLIPYYNNKQDIDINEIKNKNNNILSKQKLLELLSDIDKNKIKKCIFCKKQFDKIQELKNHIIIYCISIDECTKPVENIEVIPHLINGDNNNLNIINNTINNTININVKMDLTPFDKNWEISHLGIAEKQSLFISMYKYTKTLEYILKNENNLNVLVDKDSDKGYVYNNTIEELSVDEIIDKSFNKIYNNLNDFYNDIQNNNDYGISDEILNLHKDSIEQKFNCFYENEDTRKIVKSCISETLDKVKDKTKEAFNNLEKKKFIGY